MVLMLSVLILWMIVVPRPDRSGTVLATHMRPAHREIEPVFSPVLKMVEFEAVDYPVSWTLVVRRPEGHTMTMRVRRQVYDRCHVGDWYDSALTRAGPRLRLD
jgi:hypothetical protein